MTAPEVPAYLALEDGSQFPRPPLGNDEHYSPAHQIMWRGHETLTRSQAIWLASVADAYSYLICNPTIAKTKIPMTRRALTKKEQS